MIEKTDYKKHKLVISLLYSSGLRRQELQIDNLGFTNSDKENGSNNSAI